MDVKTEKLFKKYRKLIKKDNLNAIKPKHRTHFCMEGHHYLKNMYHLDFFPKKFPKWLDRKYKGLTVNSQLYCITIMVFFHNL